MAAPNSVIATSSTAVLRLYVQIRGRQPRFFNYVKARKITPEVLRDPWCSRIAFSVICSGSEDTRPLDRKEEVLHKFPNIVSSS